MGKCRSSESSEKGIALVQAQDAGLLKEHSGEDGEKWLTATEL